MVLTQALIGNLVPHIRPGGLRRPTYSSTQPVPSFCSVAMTSTGEGVPISPA